MNQPPLSCECTTAATAVNSKDGGSSRPTLPAGQTGCHSLCPIPPSASAAGPCWPGPAQRASCSAPPPGAGEKGLRMEVRTNVGVSRPLPKVLEGTEAFLLAYSIVQGHQQVLSGYLSCSPAPSLLQPCRHLHHTTAATIPPPTFGLSVEQGAWAEAPANASLPQTT